MVVSASSPAWTVDADVILPKLELARFQQWPEEQREAVLLGLELWAMQRVMDEITLYAEPDAGAYAIRAWTRAQRVQAGDGVGAKL